MKLEQDLRRALQRTDPPLDFTHRVLARAEREARAGRRQPAPPKRPLIAGRAGGWLAAATVAIMAAGGARYYNYQQQVAEAKRIEAEVMLAMQVTSDALSRVQIVLQDTNR